jgi:uncharacterized membrane protein YgaE (UPF0421/DUF939 family)
MKASGAGEIMRRPNAWGVLRLDRQTLEQSARTAIVAVGSVVVARVARLPESYWAPIIALVVMQSTLGAALKISGQRIVGTALGGVFGALVVLYFGSGVVAFGAGVFVMGLVCALLRVGPSAYHFSGVTLAIVMLVARNEPVWLVAVHRFCEVSVGVGVGLAVSALWPEREATTAATDPHS